MAHVVSLDEKFFEYAKKAQEMRDLQRDIFVVTNLLNGVLAEEIAAQLEIRPEALRMHSVRVRKILGLEPNNQRGILSVSFERGLTVVVSKDDLTNIKLLNEDQKRALNMIADGKSNSCLMSEFGVSANRVSKLVTSCSQVLIPNGAKRQSLLPAMTFRAVEILQARRKNCDDESYPNVTVRHQAAEFDAA